ncbi:MAG: hypothetical protein KME05_06075 [Gloeocapsa sp. UFS-A4-WI-NPMV-4B04]|nr:hypothetical protein [Gloeocapsa sp. UFS-A4-WI-NPMV-4B04]
MTTYICFETALRMLVNAYLMSVVLLAAGSYLGLTVIETIEKGSEHSPKPRFFT